MGKKEERICTTDDVQLQKPKTGCISAFLAILTAVLKSLKILGLFFTWKLIPRIEVGKKGKRQKRGRNGLKLVANNSCLGLD